MVSSTRETTLPSRQLSETLRCENVVAVACSPSQRGPCMVIHNSYLEYSNLQISISLRFPRSFDHSGLTDLNFTSLKRISACNPKSRNYVTVATPKLSRWANPFVRR